MYEKYEELLKIKGVTSADVSRATGIAESAIANWKRRRTIMKAINLKLLADYFNVPMEYFLS